MQGCLRLVALWLFPSTRVRLALLSFACTFDLSSSHFTADDMGVHHSKLPMGTRARKRAQEPEFSRPGPTLVSPPHGVGIENEHSIVNSVAGDNANVVNFNPTTNHVVTNIFHAPAAEISVCFGSIIAGEND